MEDRQVKLSVGVVAVATALILAILIAVTTSATVSVGGSQIRIKILLASAPGVGVNTPVRKNGVLIGRVEEIEFTDSGVLLTASVSKKAPVYSTDVCRVQPSSILGDAVISFSTPAPPDPRGPGAWNTPPAPAVTPAMLQPGAPPVVAPAPVRVQLQDGDVVEGVVVPSPIDVLVELQTDVGPAIKSLGEAGDAVTHLARRLDIVLGDDIGKERLATIADKLITAVDEFSVTMNQMERTMGSIDAIIGDPALQQRLKQGLAELPELVTDVRRFATQAGETLQTFDGVVTSAEANLRNIEGLTKPIGERGPELAQSVMSALENLDLVLVDFRRFSQALANSEGSIGSLVTERELYDNLNVTVCNANSVIVRLDTLLRQVSPQVRAIVNDARVVTDKVAREPGRVVTGGLAPSIAK